MNFSISTLTRSPPITSVPPDADADAESEWNAAATILRRLSAAPERFLDKTSDDFAALSAVRAEANRLIEAIKGAVRRQRGVKRESPARASSIPRGPQGAAEEGSSSLQRCYCCQARCAVPDERYAHCCPDCGDLFWRKRHQSGDLRGRTALVTGGRFLIGYEVCLKLLRAGAQVAVTTRFPRDAVRRFAQAPDFDDWGDRLRVYGLDFRHLPAVERFADEFAQEHDALDILINNAAQTVRRPPAFYAALVAGESAPLPARLALRIAPNSAHESALRELPFPTAGVEAIAGPIRAADSAVTARDSSKAAWSARLAQVCLLPGETLEDPDLFPPGAADELGQQLDLRPENSWTAQLEDVSTVELIEAHCIGAFAPFLLLRRLLPAFRRSPRRRKFAVNVSAREGRFQTFNKTSHHPHTNMTKAALNMLTRTSAQALAEDGVHLVAVDPGWISEQLPTRARESVKHPPPLDAVDAAARILDPIFLGIDDSEAQVPLFGVLLKDFRVAPW